MSGEKLKSFIQKIDPNHFAVVGLLLFLFQLIYRSIYQYSSLDEGAYLIKGLWYATGQYTPFQAYGPMTNHMPLSFLIHGYIQYWFGPSIYAARYFSSGLAFLGAVGIGLAAYRLAGSWPAAFSIWLLAINPAFAKFYSQATSQVLAFFMLAWIIAFTINPHRSKIELYLGVVLSAILTLTRINMLPVLILVWLYILWECDWKTGASSIMIGLGVLFWGYLSWPEMASFWAIRNLTGFIISYQLWFLVLITLILAVIWNKQKWEKYHNPVINSLHKFSIWIILLLIIYILIKDGADINILNTIQAIFFGYRSHFFAILGIIISYLIFSKKLLSNESPELPFLYLSTLFMVLLVSHIWKSLGGESCVYCFEVYLAFFSQIGILLFVYSLNKEFPLSKPKTLLIFSLVFILISFTGFGFAAESDLREWVNLIQVPRMKEGQILSGSTEIWRLISNKYGWQSNHISFLLSSIVGTLVGLLFLIISFTFHKFRFPTQPFTKSIFTFFVILGIFFSPTIYLGNGFRNFDCQTNMLKFYDNTGKELASIINDQDQLFWWDASPVPLLYISQRGIYPQQMNAKFNYSIGGDTQDHLRGSRWNDEIGKQWAEQADYILVKPEFIRDWLEDIIDAQFREVSRFKTDGECTLSRTLLLYINEE